MSKYKRHAQGGRFRTANFGDLGLRAFKEQQERQIRGLKEQNEQDQAYSRQHLRRLEGNAAKEIQHNRELQNFYNKRDDLAIDNTQLRGRREVEALMGEAKEYEKQAAFWKDFSTTYSQQYIKAAGDIYDIATTAQSNHQMTALDNDPKYKKFSQGASKLNNLADYEGLKTQRQAYRDFTKGKISEKELNDIVGHVSEISLRMNSKTKKALLQREADEFKQEIANLKALAEEKGIQWNAETASEFIYLRSRELMRAYGVDPSSQAGRDFMENVRKHEFNETKKLTDISIANAQMQTFADMNEQSENLVSTVQFHDSSSDKALKKKGVITGTGDNFIAYNANNVARINHKAHTYSINENGEVVPPTHNIHYAAEEIWESDIMSGKFVSKEQAKNHTINQPVPDAKLKHHDDGKTITYSEKDTWIGKFGENAENTFEELWAKYEKETATKFKNKKESDDNEAQIEIDRRAKLDPSDEEYLNLQDPKVIDGLIKTHAGKEDTIEMLQNYKLFAPYNKNNTVVTSNLTNLHKAGKLKELTEYLQYLPKDAQEAWAVKVEQLEVLDRMGYTGTNLTGKAKTELSKILGKEATEPGAMQPYDHIITLIKQDILKTFDEVYETAGPSDLEKIDALRDRLKEKIQLGETGTIIGEGIWRRRNTDMSTEFLVDIDENDLYPTVTKQEIDKKLSGSKDGLDNLFTGMTEGSVRVKDVATGNESSKTLIPIDEADTAIRHLNEGIPIKKNDIVEHIFHRQPLVEGKKQYTRRDIWNKYFESIGVNVVVPAGSIEKADATLEQSPLKVTKNLSDVNKEVVGVLADLINEGVIDVTTYRTKESIKEEKKKGLFSHPFFTSPHPFAD